MSMILKAAAITVRAHQGQKRKYNGRPYVTHPARVAGRVGLLPGVTEEMVAAAYLHDVLEDTPITKEEIDREISPQVGYYVDWLTNRSKGGGLPRAGCKMLDRQRLAEAPIQVKQIKALDRIDNLLELLDAPADFKRLYAEESLLLADVLGSGPLVDELRGIAEKVKDSVKE